MMHYWPTGPQGTPGFSLTKAVEDVNRHSSTEIEALKENQLILRELQVLINFSFHFTHQCSTVFIN